MAALPIGFDQARPPLAGGNMVNALITGTMTAAAMSHTYQDIRVRTEGLDLDMSAADLFDRAD